MYPKACFSPNRPLGENAIATKLKVVTKKLGLGDVSGHALRRLCGTTLHNAEGVSVEEALATMRHGSTASARTYMVRGQASEENKLSAFKILSRVQRRRNNIFDTNDYDPPPDEEKWVQTPCGNHILM